MRARDGVKLSQRYSSSFLYVHLSRSLSLTLALLFSGFIIFDQVVLRVLFQSPCPNQIDCLHVMVLICEFVQTHSSLIRLVLPADSLPLCSLVCLVCSIITMFFVARDDLGQHYKCWSIYMELLVP